MSAIETEALSKRYADKDVLIDVSLGVEEGSIFGLLGPNGAANTTLSRNLLGLAAPSSGGGRLLSSPLPPTHATLCQIGAMVEEPAFYPWMSARRHLQVHARLANCRCSREDISQLLDRVGLADSANKAVKRFSQGMRQRLGLARALLRKPHLLVLDEPANGLDPPGIVWLRECLRELRKEGVTVLVSTHQLGEIELVCDSVAILNQGRLVETFRMSDIDTEQPAVRIVVAPSDHDAAAAVLAVHNAAPRGRGEFVVAADGPTLARLLAESGVYPISIEPERRLLERRFFESIGSPQ